MKSSKLIKAATLLSFAFLIISFVAYRSGVFDKFLTKNKNSSALSYEPQTSAGVTPIDSPIVETHDSTKVSPTMMSTSKSMILIDDKFSIKNLKGDTTKKSSDKKPALKNQK